MIRNKAGLSVVLIAVAVVIFTALAQAEDRLVAKVNDAGLTERDINDAINDIIPAAVFHSRLTPEKKASLMPKAIELMIEKELFYQEAKRRGMKIDKKSFKEAKDKVIERLGGKAVLKKALKQWGMSEKDYDTRLERVLLINDIGIKEIEEKAVVSPEEISEYYEKNKTSFFRPEARRLRHILIKVDPSSTDEDRGMKRKRGDEVIEKAKSGVDFGQLAWDYSDDPYRVKGGDLGLLHKGRLEPELDKVAFSLGLGAISNVVETIYGYHIIKVEEVKEPEQLKLEDVSHKIERQLKEKKLKEAREAFIGGLKGNARIEVYEH